MTFTQCHTASYTVQQIACNNEKMRVFLLVLGGGTEAEQWPIKNDFRYY
jgi:hypothetical protein